MNGLQCHLRMNAKEAPVSVLLSALILFLPSSADDRLLHGQGMWSSCTRTLGSVLVLRGGSNTDWLATANDNGLLRKRQRAQGVSFQAVVDSEGARNYFGTDEIERLRRQFVQGQGEDDLVPVTLLGQLRLRISMKRDKISRSLITGEPVSISEDDGLCGFGGGDAATHPPPRQQQQRAPTNTSEARHSGVQAAVQAAVDRARERVAPGVERAGRRDKHARAEHDVDKALLHYNPSILGDAAGADDARQKKPTARIANARQSSAATPPNVVSLARHTAGNAREEKAREERLDGVRHGDPGAWESGTRCAGGSAARGIMDTGQSSVSSNTNASTSEYIGWVGAQVFTLPDSRLQT
jgi:hypothetical protein